MGKCAEHVIQTDISSVPLAEGVLDVVVFSLSLMGTNFPDFLVEANRVLKNDGIVIIAEVLSRFEDINSFSKHMREEVGFKPLTITKLKEFFYLMVYKKVCSAKGLRRSAEFCR